MPHHAGQSRLRLQSIKTRLIFFFLLFGIVPAVAIVTTYKVFEGSVRNAFREPVRATAIAMADTIDRNLFERYGDVQAFGLNTATADPSNWRNPSPENPLVNAMNGYMVKYGVYRLMLFVDMQGGVLAVNSADSAGRPIETEFLHGENFASASWFRNAVAGRYLEGEGLTGTVVEQPANSADVAKIYGDDGYVLTFAAPVKDQGGKTIGVWVNFADFGLVEEIIAGFYDDLANRGMQDAELTVLDPEGRIIVDYDPVAQGWQTYQRNPEIIGKFNLAEKGVASASLAIKGETGVMLSMHARKGIEQASGFTQTKGAYGFPGLGWGVLARIPDTQVNQVSNQMALVMLIAVTTSAVVIAALSWLIGRNIASSIVGMTGAMRALASGDKSVTVPGVGRKDEIGDMAGALQVFKDTAIEAERLALEQEEMKKRAEQERHQAMLKLADRFQSSIGRVVSGILSATTEMQGSAKSMMSIAEETAHHSTAVSAASEQATTNVQTVASATEEMSASIGEITRQVAEASRIAAEAVDYATHADRIVQTLSSGAEEIDNVVELITDIANKTNLLALNATIESARAGEAGKSFAVVAAEVKGLAIQTAKATGDIGGQIATMQRVTEETADAIRNIGTTIAKISEIASNIASAVEEQDAATREIAQNAQQAAMGTRDVSSSISNVNERASQTGTVAGNVRSAAEQLKGEADLLRDEAESFIEVIRAG